MRKKVLTVLLCACLVGAVATGCKSKETGDDNTNVSGTPSPTTQVSDENKENKDTDNTNEEDKKEENKDKENKDEVNANDALLTPPAGTVKLGTYKGVEVTMLSTDVTDEEVQTGLESFVTSKTIDITDRTDVQDGDTANIDYEGKIDGEVFNGGSQTGADLVIGSNRFIDDFEKQLIGAKVGDTVEVNVTFPEDYGNDGTEQADLRGKAAVFTVKINAIKRTATMDDLTDEFIEKNATDSSKTIQEWKDNYKAGLKENKEAQAEQQFKTDAITAVIDNSTFTDISDDDIKANADSLRQQYESMAAMYGFDFPTFLMLWFGTGMTEEEFDAQIKTAGEFSIKQRLIAEEIIKTENLTLSEEEYTTGLAAYAQEYGSESPEAFETENGKKAVEKSLLLDKALQIIFDNAVRK